MSKHLKADFSALKSFSIIRNSAFLPTLSRWKAALLFLIRFQSRIWSFLVLSWEVATDNLKASKKASTEHFHNWVCRLCLLCSTTRSALVSDYSFVWLKREDQNMNIILKICLLFDIANLKLSLVQETYRFLLLKAILSSLSKIGMKIDLDPL